MQNTELKEAGKGTQVEPMLPARQHASSRNEASSTVPSHKSGNSPIAQSAAADLRRKSTWELTEELALPQGVTASLTGRVLAMKGPKGETSREFREPNVAVSVEGSKVIVSTAKANKSAKKVAGSLRAHIINMISGVTEGHVYKLKICFTHFPITAAVSGRKFIVKNFLGEKTPRQLELPENVKARVEGADVTVESASRESAGQAAASIEQATRRANYDTRVFADGIYITMKDGKEVK